MGERCGAALGGGGAGEAYVAPADGGLCEAGGSGFGLVAFANSRSRCAHEDAAVFAQQLPAEVFAEPSAVTGSGEVVEGCGATFAAAYGREGGVVGVRPYAPALDLGEEDGSGSADQCAEAEEGVDH